MCHNDRASDFDLPVRVLGNQDTKRLERDDGVYHPSQHNYDRICPDADPFVGTLIGE
jgi:hypothetical protein